MGGGGERGGGAVAERHPPGMEEEGLPSDSAPGEMGRGEEPQSRGSGGGGLGNGRRRRRRWRKLKREAGKPTSRPLPSWCGWQQGRPEPRREGMRQSEHQLCGYQRPGDAGQPLRPLLPGTRPPAALPDLPVAHPHPTRFPRFLGVRGRGGGLPSRCVSAAVMCGDR